MPVTSIDPNAVRQSESSQPRAYNSTAPDFTEVMNAASAPSTAAVGVNQGYQAAAVTSASLTGVVGAANSMTGNSPYYSTPLQIATNATYPTGGVGYPNYPSSGGIPGSSIPGSVPGTGSDTLAQQTELFHAMQDANWQMLVAQVNVNNISRDYQARSNILKTKSDTELNAVRNMRA